LLAPLLIDTCGRRRKEAIIYQRFLCEIADDQAWRSSRRFLEKSVRRLRWRSISVPITKKPRDLRSRNGEGGAFRSNGTIAWRSL
jgi:hypothetical protein